MQRQSQPQRGNGFIQARSLVSSGWGANSNDPATSGVTGESLQTCNPLMRRLVDQLECYARARATVLIHGESGTGKGVFARLIHRTSPRQGGPFISLNCASTSEGILESELFGHEKGAFTGAVQQHRGRFEQADGGTLFLDEIGTASAQVQLRLLRVLQEREFERVGGSGTVQVDVRVIAATNVDLQAQIEAGEFREDLFYRLNVLPLRLPSLRERPEDIPLLAELFLRRSCRDNQRPVQGFAGAVMERLQKYGWPGNIRQLENIVERMVVFARGDYLQVGDLPLEVAENRPIKSLDGGASSLREARLSWERGYLCQALERRNGVIARVAQDMGISRKNLYMKLDNLEIDYQRFRT
ncbi:MAG: AAA domain-containing protein [Candidatus Latescibacteria bacterium]|nr:AAA domain-containing protein [Candidatus Latescibacterota bacterium]